MSLDQASPEMHLALVIIMRLQHREHRFDLANFSASYSPAFCLMFSIIWYGNVCLAFNRPDPMPSG